jgi:cytochrome P450
MIAKFLNLRSRVLKDLNLPNSTDRLTMIVQAAKKYGDVVSTPRGWMFFHPDAVRDILVTNDRCFCKSPDLRWTKYTLGNGLLTSEGEFHRRQRRLIQPLLHPARLAGYAEIMTRHASETAQRWKDGSVIELHREMMRMALCIVAEALFGASVGPEVDAISDAMDCNVEMFRRVTSPWGKVKIFMPLPFNFRFFFARRKLVSTLKHFIHQRRVSGEVRDDLLGRLLAAQDPEGGGGMSERQLVDECIILFAAGHETTANALSFTLWLLTQNPDAERRLHAEVDAVLGERAAPTMEDLDRLVYARQVVAESMRLYPPAWIQGRQVVEPCTIGGQALKKGEVVFVCQWVTHRDVRWWPAPERFEPLRFSADSGSTRPRWAYFPFGGGSRACVGEAFAWAEATLVLATLVKRWRMEPLIPGPLTLEPGITLRSKNDMDMTLQLRK